MSATHEPYAFPNQDYVLGMKLRDYFAAEAMAASLARNRECTFEDLSIQDRSSNSYLIADAMIEERKERQFQSPKPL